MIEIVSYYYSIILIFMGNIACETRVRLNGVSSVSFCFVLFSAVVFVTGGGFGLIYTDIFFFL